MKLIRSAKDQFMFQLSQQEKILLLEVLRLYPRIPPAHHRLSQSARLPDQEAGQRLLEEALAEHRADNKKQLMALLASPRRLAPHEHGWQLAVLPTEVEWLLQVLNDIRVGSWLLLGSPEERFEQLNAQTAPHLWAMEIAGSFQMALLRALEAGT